jgi:DNA replication protein DnaC
MIEAFDRVYKETLDNNLTQLDFIEMLLDEEVINRENNRYKRLLKNASFPM